MRKVAFKADLSFREHRLGGGCSDRLPLVFGKILIAGDADTHLAAREFDAGSREGDLDARVDVLADDPLLARLRHEFAAHQDADLGGVLLEHAVALGLAHALDQHLLRGLDGVASEVLDREREANRLAELGLVLVETVETILVARLTERGEAVALGNAHCEGVLRAHPGCPY